MNSIRILAVASYKGMEKLMNQIDHEADGMDIRVFAGYLEKTIANEHDQNYDFIISRNETLRLISPDCHIPIVEIPLSEYDILHAISVAKGFSDKFCVVGFPGVIARIQTLCSLMEMNINVSIINNSTEADKRIQKLKKEGYTLIVGDAQIVDTAKKLRLRGILIMSGKESILSTLNECKKLHDIMVRTKDDALSLRQIVDNCPVYIFTYNRQKKIIHTNVNRTSNQEELAPLLKLLPSLAEKVFERQELKLIRKSGAFFWSIHGIQSASDMVCFYIRRLMGTGSHNAPLSIQDDFSGNTAIMQSYYLESASMGSVIAKAKQIGRSEYPVLLTGEPGTGKNTMAFAIHRQSKLQNNTFLIINCQLITEKELKNLLEEDDSPLNENNIGIHFRDIHYLSSKGQKQLIAYIKETYLHRRNRVIYTYTFSFTGKEEHSLLKYLKNERECDCLIQFIPPLRERKEDIAALAALYINELNSEYGKQIVGLENDSLGILKEYDWPENLGQFIRVIKDLVLNTEGAHIKADEVRAVIAKEKLLSGENCNFISLEGSLNKICSDVIWQVFKEENMNQCRAAKRLGISRSTMWRKLKEFHSETVT
jgi:transcriptional regulator with PAS, ATPase and Fis domain